MPITPFCIDNIVTRNEMRNNINYFIVTRVLNYKAVQH